MTRHAFVRKDKDGNQCVYIQEDDDMDSRELHDMIEADIKDAPDMDKQLNAYLQDAESICQERNEEEDEE